MPDTLDVTCPNCDKGLKVPAELAGKRVKCKGCQEVFTIRPPARAAGKPAAKPAAKAAKPAPRPAPPAEAANSPFIDDDDARPMEVVREEDVARCPHCAKELDPPDAVVCHNCGYNNVTRQKAETKRVIAADATDWTSHLAPGIVAVLVIIGLIALDIFCLVNMRGWLEGSQLELDEKDLSGNKKMLVKPGAFSTMIIAASLFVILPAIRFAIRRLVYENKPEEKVKK